MRQQRLGAAGALLDPLMAAPRERPVAGKMRVAVRLGDVGELLARRERSVERDIFCRHWADFTGFRGGRRDACFAPGQIGGFPYRNQQLIPVPEPVPCIAQLSTSLRRAARAADDAGKVMGLSEAPVNAGGMKEASARAPGPGRAHRLIGGWSANLVQMALGVTQQVALVPVFLHFWSSEVLAAWLVIYAAGNLALVADCGL